MNELYFLGVFCEMCRNPKFITRIQDTPIFSAHKIGIHNEKKAKEKLPSCKRHPYF